MSGINDPFAFEQSTDPNAGALGVAPSAWQHLAMFGSNMVQSANARTADGHLANGTGFMGPFGAAVGQTVQQGMQQAQAGALIRHANAQTQGMGIQNRVNEAMAPLQIQQAQLRAQFLQNPELIGEFMRRMGGGNTDYYGGGYAAGGPPGGQAPVAGLPDAMHRLEYNGGPGTSPGMYMDGGSMAAGPTSVHQAALTDFNNANKTNYSLADLASNPKLGTQVGDWYLQSQVQRFGPRMGLAAYNAGPGRVGQALQSGQGEAGLPASTQAYVNRGMAMLPGGGGQGPQPQPTGYQPGGAQQPPAMQPPMQPPGGQAGPINPQQAWQLSRSLLQRADQIEQMKAFGLPVPGDPVALRAQAAELTKVATAGPQAAATANATNSSDLYYKPQIAGQQKAAELPYELAGKGFGLNADGTQNQIPGSAADLNYQREKARQDAIGAGMVKPFSDKAGNSSVNDANGNRIYIGRGSEVKPIWNPATGREEFGDVGGIGFGALENLGKPYIPGVSPTGLPPVGQGSGQASAPGPAEKGYLEGGPKIQQNFIDHDNKMVDEDLAHVIENVTPAKQQLFQLRALNDSGANTGAAAELRMNFKNWVNTFAPDFASKITGDASPMQEFKKIALMGAGKQERGDLGARGGFRAMELYLSANPNLDNQPTANHDMANALLISHQYHEDYARGATDFFNKQIQGVQQANSTKGYQKVSNYDQAYIEKFRPELYASAISAMNGKPYAEWSKGLTPAQMQIVGGILQRADPNAAIDVHGKQIPVSAFQKTLGPTDIMGGGSNGR